MKTYSEKLQDPRWQTLRLLKLEETSYTCADCGAKDIELHVHHKEYINGLEPWEYSFEELEVLCLYCHEKEHGIHRYNEVKQVSEILLDLNLFAQRGLD